MTGSTNNIAELRRIFPGESELAGLMRSLDWSKTDLGPPEAWPENLRIALSICLTSRFPMQVWWGPNYTMLYNDAYVPFLGRDSTDGTTRGKHPRSLGRPAREIWSELWHQIGPMLETARTRGIASWSEDIQMFFDRKIPISQGGEEVYVSFSFSPIFASGGVPGVDAAQGVFCACIEVSEKVFLARQLQTALEDSVQSKNALRESEDRFRTLADNMPQLTWMADGQGNVDWFNRGWLEYTGTTHEQNVGTGWKNVHHPDHIEKVAEKFERYLREGRDDWEDTFPLRRHDGEYRWFLSRMTIIRDAHGKVVRFFGTNTDVTEQLANEEELRRAKEVAEAALADTIKAARMKDEFLATLSHELRTPMSAILGWIQLLKRGSSQNSIDQGIEVIDRNARLQAQIIEDLLDMNRILAGKLRLEIQSVSLGKVVTTAVESIRPAAEAKGVKLHAVCDSEMRDVRGDPNRLQQVVYNLLSNAVKFTPGGGKIQVVCRRINSHIEISVSDNGKGIAAEFLPYVFERFRQQDAAITRTFGGLGLGLSIVKQIVELHGGKVQAASEGDGKGATFTVHLPVALALRPELPAGALERAHPSRAMQEAQDLDAIDASRIKGRTILVIDDERDACELICRVLEERGANCLVASSGEEALKFFQSDARPDLIISDLGMPGMSGHDLMAKVRQLTPERGGAIPAIALSAFARPEDRTRSLLAGFQLHLSKPVELGELLASIVSLMG